jgi:hypothetical protein
MTAMTGTHPPPHHNPLPAGEQATAGDEQSSAHIFALISARICLFSGNSPVLSFE